MAAGISTIQKEYRAARLLLTAARRRLTKQVQLLFDECDRDESGSVSAGEFVGRILNQTSGTAYDVLRRRLREKVRLFRELDEDSDHKVSLDEMLEFFFSD